MIKTMVSTEVSSQHMPPLNKLDLNLRQIPLFIEQKVELNLHPSTTLW